MPNCTKGLTKILLVSWFVASYVGKRCQHGKNYSLNYVRRFL